MAILIPRLDRDELAHPLDHPAAGEPAGTDPPSGNGKEGTS
jgi:hypothetical protein